LTPKKIGVVLADKVLLEVAENVGPYNAIRVKVVHHGQAGLVVLSLKAGLAQLDWLHKRILYNYH
jgi:hypothetical protein